MTKDLKTFLTNVFNTDFMKETGMTAYFADHSAILGVDTEVLCFVVYHCGQWNLTRFRYGERI